MSKKLLLPFLWLCALNVGAQTLNCRVLSTINAPDLGEDTMPFLRPTRHDVGGFFGRFEVLRRL